LFLLFVASSLIFFFEIFPLIIPEMPAGFTCYIVQVIPNYLGWIP
jgi:hypothetical protein